MSNKNKVKPIGKLRLYLGWFGLLTPVFGAGMLAGIGLLGALDSIFIVQVVVASGINYFVGRYLLKPVVVIRGEEKTRSGI